MQRDSEPIEYIIKPFQAFSKHKLAGAILLLAATVAAIVWANSPWAHAYEHFLETKASIGVGAYTVSKTLHHWINDGLMGIFFFVVGLEIKREILAGELATLRKAALPAVAAAGGMLVPALLYLAFNYAGGGAKGWGIPMATDIAFALGVLALVSDRVPVGLKIFLTALAIVDDIGAVLVIALFYTDYVNLVSLALGVLLLAVSVGGNLLGVRYAVFYLVAGTLAWLAFLESGVHATLAAVLMAFTIPARMRADGDEIIEKMQHHLASLRAVGIPDKQRLLSPDQAKLLVEMEHAVEDSTPPLQGMEHALVPMVTFLILPVFALANAGVHLSGGFGQAFLNPICIGVFLGLFVGKQLGIFGFTWLAVKSGIADLPSRVTWRHVYGTAALGGIGFTMSLFIGSLAFVDPGRMEVVKVGILSASVASGLLGWLVLRGCLRCNGG